MGVLAPLLSLGPSPPQENQYAVFPGRHLKKLSVAASLLSKSLLLHNSILNITASYISIYSNPAKT